MVLTRERPETKERHARRPSSRKLKAHELELFYVCLPRAVLVEPPIAHPNTPAAKKALSVFEFTIATAAIAMARHRIGAKRHAHALTVGKAAIQRRRKDRQGADEYDFKAAGSDGYDEGRHQFNRDPAAIKPTIRVVVRKRALLTTACLSTGGKNQNNLPAALDRLLLPVRVAERTMPPVLKGWRVLRSGKLRLSVNSKWLPYTISRVRLPVPTKSSQALALYLFLHATDQRFDSDTNNISTSVLYRRLGIPMNRSWHAEAALDRALGIVNAHLREREWPVRYHAIPLKHGTRLRFVSRDPRQSVGEP